MMKKNILIGFVALGAVNLAFAQSINYVPVDFGQVTCQIKPTNLGANCSTFPVLNKNTFVYDPQYRILHMTNSSGGTIDFYFPDHTSSFNACYAYVPGQDFTAMQEPPTYCADSANPSLTLSEMGLFRSVDSQIWLNLGETINIPHYFAKGAATLEYDFVNIKLSKQG